MGPATNSTAWEIESRSWGMLIQPLPAHAKRVLCLDLIAMCLTSVRPALEEALGAPPARLADRALGVLRHHADDPSPGEPDPEFPDCLRALREYAHLPVVAPVVTALTAYADALPAGLDASDVLVVMSACHEATLQAEPGRVEQALARLITAQRGLIDAAALV
jgi:hypothetical protein